MTFKILLKEAVDADKATVWTTINDLNKYPQWNPFVVKCISTLEVGAPIVMYLRLTPGMTLRQKETVLAKRDGEFLEHGVTLPYLFKSSRQHIITATSGSTCRYESIFTLEGPLAPLINFLLKSWLRKSFLSMSFAVKDRANALYKAK